MTIPIPKSKKIIWPTKTDPVAVEYNDKGEPTNWTLTLNKYQRDNLMRLLQACGITSTNSVEPFTIINNGDWLAEIIFMLLENPSDYSEINKPNFKTLALDGEIKAWLADKLDKHRPLKWNLGNILPKYKKLMIYHKASVSKRIDGIADVSGPGHCVCPWCDSKMKERPEKDMIAICENNPEHIVQWISWGG